MASFDTLLIFSALSGEPPATSPAQFTVRNQNPVVAYDDTIQESMIFSSLLPRHYREGDVVATIVWTSTAVTGNVQWRLSYEDTLNLNNNVWTDLTAVTVSAPTTNGLLIYTPINISNTIFETPLGHFFRIRITRITGIANNITGDCHIRAIEIRET